VPSFDLCQPCELNLRCLGGTQIHATQALEENRLCVRHRNLIEFRYHGTVCLTCDLAAKTVTDHRMYGFSVTTSGNIRKYLNALADNFPELNLTGTRIDELICAFKADTSKDGLWHHV